MTSGFDKLLARLNIPNLDGTIAATRQQSFSFRIKRHGTHAAGVVEGMNLLLRLHVPDDGVAVVAAGGEIVSLRRESEGPDRRLMGLQRPEHFLAGDVPE